MKQLISHKYKSYKDVIVWTKDGKVIKPELAKDLDRGVQATMQQVDFTDDDEYFPKGKDGNDSEEDLSTWRAGGPEGSPRDPLMERVIQHMIQVEPAVAPPM